MKFLRNKINFIISLLVVIMVALILFSSQRYSKSKLEGIIGQSLSPIQKVMYNISKVVSDTYNGFVKNSKLVDEIESLNKENGELKAVITSYKHLKSENDKLREILNFKNRFSDYQLIGSNIIGRSGFHTNDYIIDIGAKDGIKKSMVVIANGGLFGIISSVSDHWSLVSPIINASISVGATIKKENESQGIVKGYDDVEDKYNLKMEYLSIDGDVLVGDTVVTSGLGGVYPANIVIGEVMYVEDDQRSVTKNVFLKSHVNFDYVKELFVVLPKYSDKVQY